MSTLNPPRHDSGVHVDTVSTQPSTPPLTYTPASSLPSQQSPESESRSESQSESQSESPASSVTEVGDGDGEESDLDLDDNGVHFCHSCYIRYLRRLKRTFRDRLRVYLEMKRIVTAYYQQRLVTKWVVLRVNLLLSGEPRLLNDFYDFLPLEWWR